MSTEVAVRVFTDSKTNQQVKAAIHLPHLVAKNQWGCDISIIGASLNVKNCAYGIDELQALVLGVEMLKTEIRFLDSGTLHFDGGPDLLIGLEIQKGR